MWIYTISKLGPPGSLDDCGRTDPPVQVQQRNKHGKTSYSAAFGTDVDAFSFFLETFLSVNYNRSLGLFG
jgi:hypothetical protein